MEDLLGPWAVVGGYLLSFVLLWIAGRSEARGPVAAAICYALCGIAVAGTTLYWLAAGADSLLSPALCLAIVLVVVALIVGRGWQQQRWIKRLSAAAEPSFGLLPHRGRAVPLDHPDPGPRRRTVEFEHRGHRLLGMEYSTEPPQEGGKFAFLSKLAEEIDSINSVVELRIPQLPALTISPNTKAFEPEFFTPLEDARIVRNQFGWLRPDTTLHSHEVDPEFDRRFSVYTSDPEFAAAVLTGECREMIMNDLWFRVHQFAIFGDAMWTTDTGGLTEDRMFGNARRLAMLAAVIPAPVWEVWGGDRAYGALAARSDTSYYGWFGRRGGFVRTPVNRRREAADRQPLTSISLTLRSLIMLGMVALGLGTLTNSAAVLTGLAPHAQLTVTNISGGSARHCVSTTGGFSCSTDRPSVQGTYVEDGSVRETSADWSGDLPSRGDVVEIAVGPFWGNPGYQSGAWTYPILDFLVTLLFPLAGVYLARRTYWPRPPRRVRKQRESTVAA
ncbi:hypothetical protein [Amycolatopsis jiangsuensis]|uniref:Uncharacterized protein n=1 Tax=Amycolatopsis jiangsuensis TaxID=1181879 RepID=A0A840IZA7_9PSEU|nr:hypothetical protein [Amycolatopsis jiangsuensis]MBB4686488.1 hypothetical protein [Amycolatopsis jiangsuensis]